MRFDLALVKFSFIDDGWMDGSQDFFRFLFDKLWNQFFQWMNQFTHSHKINDDVFFFSFGFLGPSNFIAWHFVFIVKKIYVKNDQKWAILKKKKEKWNLSSFEYINVCVCVIIMNYEYCIICIKKYHV